MSFIDKLQILNMEPKKSGLLLVSDKYNPNIKTETERRMLYIAEKDYNADAVYFRKFEDKRPPIAQLFIYNNTKGKLNNNQIIENHKRIWSSEIVPLYYIFEKTQLIVVNGKKKIVIEGDEENFEETLNDRLDFLTDLEKEYDAQKHPYKAYFFDNGSFWETEKYINQFIIEESPFDILIENLKILRNELNDRNLETNISNRLIVQSILIKYLEEKRDKDGNNVFTVKGNILEEKWQARNFVEIIQKGKLLNVFDYLAEQYNGKIFEWNNKDEVKDREIVANLSQEQLNLIAYYFGAKLKFQTKQLVFWKLYSFQYLPVELISRIYEEFLPDMPGVVYTPPFLVDFLIDESMPLDEYKKFETGKFKILDPSSGSGIFCVSAYKRLIDWYKINRYYKTTETWDKPVDTKTLKRILRENIFGTDIEKEAVRIAVFSLTLALIEKLTPLQILEELKLDDLSKENIIYENFFSFFNKHKDNPDFDLVIGNPPFNPPNEVSNGKYFKKLKKECNIKVSYKIPDDNLALVFLDRTSLLTKPKGLTCLILPSSPLLYGKWSMNYRNHFLQKFQVPQIVDFTHLRRILFKSKSNQKEPATCAIFVKNQKPDLTGNICHIIANRTKKEQNRLFFLFDHYNFHIINYKRALNERYIWKANLVGGGRLGRIAEKLNNIKPKLGEYIENKRNEGWQYGEGYIKGKAKDKEEQIEKNFSKAEWLFEKPLIKSKSFKENGEFETDINYGIELFQCTREENKNIFKSPHLIIHQKIGKKNIPIAYLDNNESLIFNNQYIGVYSPEKDELKKIFNHFNKYAIEYRFSVYLSSYRLLIDKETSILKTDIDNLPYPKDKKELELSEIEKIWRDDVLNYYIHQAKAPQNNPLNKELKDIEKQIIEYGNIFCKVMNASYGSKENFSFKQGESFETTSYIATCFHYTDKEIQFSFLQNSEQDFKEYFENQTVRNQKITRIVKYYHGDDIWFIKPRQIRYWLKSIADRDAIDCINDIINKK